MFRKPLAVETAFDLVEAWLRQPPVTVPEPTGRHLFTMRDLLSHLGTGGNLTTDAHLAAPAVEHGAELCSADSDLARFRGLRWRNPLQ
ncbi:MAG TPA: TA system VapC family ribonuclease toxin [Candidatus Sulfopaludibacter sp.]|nr:TA system VapC family ribonuclease toxin [Candidatus Sulfopaludibacter sp.]